MTSSRATEHGGPPLKKKGGPLCFNTDMSARIPASSLLHAERYRHGRLPLCRRDDTSLGDGDAAADKFRYVIRLHEGTVEVGIALRQQERLREGAVIRYVGHVDMGIEPVHTAAVEEIQRLLLLHEW